MNFKIILLFWVIGFFSSLQAAPSFWNVPDATPTPIPPPEVQDWGNTSDIVKPTPTPIVAPIVEIPSSTPTAVPGLSPKSPTQAALFSVFIPGSGQVYAGDPIKGIVFASLFGLGLWQTLDNLQLVDGIGDTKNETAGNLFGLATLAVYGFGIQDAYNTANIYNKKNYLTLHFGISPRPNANLAYMF